MRNRYILLAICVLLGYGCAPSLEPQRRAISLSVSSGDVTIDNTLATKADDAGAGEQLVSADPFTGKPSVNNPLDVALWLSSTPGKFSHDPQAPQYLPCLTTAVYKSSAQIDIRCEDQLVLYPIASDHNYSEIGGDVYCVGFHPSTGWDEGSASSSSHAINGSEDLMLADQMKGSYSSNFGAQKYEHLLTWVKLNVKATSVQTAGVWGDVESMKIVSPNSTVSVAFASSEQDGDPSSDLSSTISYTGDPVTFPLALPEKTGLNITLKTFAQAFCAPPAMAKKNAQGKYEYVSSPDDETTGYGYIVRVKTKNLAEKEVFIELKAEDNETNITDPKDAAGKLFVLTLQFNEVAVIEGVCTLKQWDDQISDIYLQ